MVGRILLFLLGLIVLLVAAAVIIPFFIPGEVYRTQITNAARDATGRELTIRGDINLSLLPPISLKVSDVQLSNAEWGEAEHLATVQTLSVGIEVLPFIFGQQVKISSFVLEEPQINLETDRNGKGNWEFEPQGGADASVRDVSNEQGGSGQEASQPASGGQDQGINDISLGDVRLVNGRISYLDGATNERQTAENINLSIGLPSLDGPLTMNGGATYNGEALSVDARIDSPRQFMDGTNTGVRFDLSSELINAQFAGNAASDNNEDLPVRAAGDASVTIPSLRRLSAWAGQPMEDGEGFEELAVSGTLEAANAVVAFNNANVTFDDIKGEGEVAANLGGRVPKVTGDLKLNKVDTRPYEGASEQQANAAPQVRQVSNTQNAPQGWSDEPIDFSGLRDFEADITMSMDGLETSTLRMGPSAGDLKVQGGVLTLNLSEMDIYEGGGRIFTEVDATQAQARITNRMNLNAIQARPMFADLIGSGIITGLGDMELDITTRGASQASFVRGLNGKTELSFNDGKLFGSLDQVDEANRLGRAIAVIANGLVLASQLNAIKDDQIQGVSQFLSRPKELSTDFASITGAFNTVNGVADTNINFVTPVQGLAITGEINMVNQTLDLLIKPNQCSGDMSRITKFLCSSGIPVRGPWVSVRPALPTPEAILSGAVKDQIRDRIPGGLGDLIPGRGGGN